MHDEHKNPENGEVPVFAAEPEATSPPEPSDIPAAALAAMKHPEEAPPEKTDLSRRRFLASFFLSQKSFAFLA